MYQYSCIPSCFFGGTSILIDSVMFQVYIYHSELSSRTNKSEMGE